MTKLYAKHHPRLSALKELIAMADQTPAAPGITRTVIAPSWWGSIRSWWKSKTTKRAGTVLPMPTTGYRATHRGYANAGARRQNG